MRIFLQIVWTAALVVAAPPVARNEETNMEKPEVPKDDKPILRPIHLEGIPLERDGDINKDFRQEILLGNGAAVESGEENSEAQKELIRDMFKSTDMDHDDKLSPQELEDRIANNTLAHLEESKRNASLELKHVDADGDGSVIWDEYAPHYLAGTGEKHEHIAEPVGEDDSMRLNEERTAFEKADLNKNGALDEHEWVGFLHPELSDQSLLDMAAEILVAYDKDKDGKVSRDEFVMSAPGEADEEWKELENEERKRKEHDFDNDIDLDGNGIATADELFHFVDPKNRKMAKREVQEILNLADTDGDGLLTLEELLEREWLFETSALLSAKRMLHDDL